MTAHHREGWEIADEGQRHLARHILTTNPDDIFALMLWVMATHFLDQVSHSVRLSIESSMPGAGKSTALEHLQRLCAQPRMIANAPTAAYLARTAKGSTLLVDEVDTHVGSSKAHGDVFGILNAGYAKGGTYGVLEQGPQGDWRPVDHDVFGAVAMAGISPHWPEAFRTRCLTVHLTPDRLGKVQPTSWVDLGESVQALGEEMAAWAARTTLPSPDEVTLPSAMVGRLRDLYLPLMQVAEALGGDWPYRCRDLLARVVERAEADSEAARDNLPPHLLVVRDIYGVWHLVSDEAMFAPTRDILDALHRDRVRWGDLQVSGPPLTAQALGKMLTKNGIYSTQQTTGERARGYREPAFHPIWEALGLVVPHDAMSTLDLTG